MAAMQTLASPSAPDQATDHMAADAVQAAVQGVLGTLRVAQALVASRRSVDLTGLDGIVGVLCAQILDIAPGLAPARAQTMRSRLIEIAAQLDTLQGLMERDAAS